MLRHELAVLRRQVARPRLEGTDRVFLAAASRLLSRASWQSFFVRPDTLLGWHRQLVRRRWTYAGRRPGRPAISEEVGALVLRLARENPRCGYQLIVGELAGVGVRVSATSVATILRQAGIQAAHELRRWYTFLGLPFALSALFFMGAIGTGHLWLIGGTLITGPGLLIMAFIYLGLSSDTN